MSNELTDFPRTWAQLTRHRKNLMCAYALGHRVYSYNEMLTEARAVWAEQPTCSVFFMGFEWLNESRDYPVLVQMVKSYTDSLDEAALVERLCKDNHWNRKAYTKEVMRLTNGDEDYYAFITASADQRCHAAMLALGYIDA